MQIILDWFICSLLALDLNNFSEWYFTGKLKKSWSSTEDQFILFHTGVAQNWLDHNHTTDSPTGIEIIVQEEILAAYDSAQQDTVTYHLFWLVFLDL